MADISGRTLLCSPHGYTSIYLGKRPEPSARDGHRRLLSPIRKQCKGHPTVHPTRQHSSRTVIDRGALAANNQSHTTLVDGLQPPVEDDDVLAVAGIELPLLARARDPHSGVRGAGHLVDP